VNVKRSEETYWDSSFGMGNVGRGGNISGGRGKKKTKPHQGRKKYTTRGKGQTLTFFASDPQPSQLQGGGRSTKGGRQKGSVAFWTSNGEVAFKRKTKKSRGSWRQEKWGGAFIVCVGCQPGLGGKRGKKKKAEGHFTCRKTKPRQKQHEMERTSFPLDLVSKWGKNSRK